MARLAAVKILAAVCFATGLHAQEQAPHAAPAASTPPSNPIVNAPGPSKPTSGTPATPVRRRRAISPEVAAQLAAVAPKFTPPPPKPTEEEEDLRESDKPRNGIIRLPTYVIRERPIILTERAVHTRKGLEDLAVKRYVSEGFRVLNAVRLPLIGASAEQYAMALYEEDERLKNMSDLAQDAAMVSATDKAAGLYVKRAANDTFRREGSFDRRR